MPALSRSARWLRLIQTLTIRTRDRRLARLAYNAPQMRVWNGEPDDHGLTVAERIDKLIPIRLIVLKARRHGISTEVESWLMAFIASSDNVNALVTAHMKKPAQKIWSMSKLFVNASPTLKSIASIGNSTISIGRSTLEVSTAGSPESERGGDLTAWHASEASRYPHPELMTATMQSLPHSKNIFSIGVIESTANGLEGTGEEFYDEWTRACEGDSEWQPIFLPWHSFPEYTVPSVLALEDLDAEEYELRARFELTDGQLAWRRWAIKNQCKGRVQIYRQEYPATAEESFIQSGLPFFQPHELLWLSGHLKDGKRFVVEPDGKLTPAKEGYLEIFKLPERGHSYVVGADSSMGMPDRDDHKEHSRSAGCVMDMDTMEQVAEYDAASAPHVFAKHLVGIGRLYNTALLAPEVQSSGGGGGREVLVYIRAYDYYNLHQWRGDPDKIRRHDALLFGWETNSKTRPRMLARIREVVMEKTAILHSKRLFKQLTAFGEDDHGYMEALAGRDDLLFAFGIALMSRSENWYKMVSASGASFQMPDWRALGIHVLHQESAGERLRRLIESPDKAAHEKTFQEL